MRVVGILAALASLLYADDRCRSCHSDKIASYRMTGMGRSIGTPVMEHGSEQSFKHQFSGTEFRITQQQGRLVHQMMRNGHRASYTPAWTVGSGNQGKSYLIAIGDSLFQSPISWYTARRSWDVSPGFEKDKEPDFFRPVTSDCLFCHSGSALPREGTLNRYQEPPFQQASIGCDRCHGDASAHLTSPAKQNIVNPSRLEKTRRDAVCEQCHLSGEARIPNPGKKFSDFRPGMRLEEVFSIYVKRGDPVGLKVVSHSEQMARSRCFLESGRKLWCTTCHDPHQQPANKASWYRNKCMGCHEKKGAHEEKAGSDCAGCHMPETRVYDGGHTAFHDHWIRLDRKEGKEAGEGLRAWREPDEPLRRRNLGLAYISVAMRDGVQDWLSQGFNLLTAMPADGAVETARGLVLLRANKAAEAVKAFRRAVDEQPEDSTRRLNLAAALLAAGERDEARQNAEKAIALEPLLDDAYVLLAEIEPRRAGYWKDRYRKLAPQRVLE